MTTINIQIACQKIISGGQTGIDRGALDACLRYNFPAGGWCPKGRLAEDGRIDRKYPLSETISADYRVRNRKNAKMADRTLIISNGNLKGGTLLTLEIVQKLRKPFLILKITDENQVNYSEELTKWLKETQIRILNVAGPRQSEWPEGYNKAFNIISDWIENMNIR